MNKKSKETTTIEVSIETYDKLHSIQKKIEEILNHKTSLDKVIKIILAINPEDALVAELLGVD